MLSVFHNRRWDSDWLSVTQAIGDGVVGRPMHLRSHIDRFRPAVRDRWREGGGILAHPFSEVLHGWDMNAERIRELREGAAETVEI